MTTDKPEPLVPAEVDLRDFATMPLAVQLLRDSRFAAEVSPEAFRAGVLLWCAAWHQVPAGTLPDNDAELAKLAGYGFVVKEWRKVKAQAMTKFVLCSDGRWHHEELAERAVVAWRSRLDHFYERAKERLRKANKARSEEKPPRPALPALTFEQWNERRKAAGTPMEKAEAFAGVPEDGERNSGGSESGIPPENALKGTERERRRNGEGESLGSVPDGTGAAAPPASRRQPAGNPPPPDPGPAPSAVDTIFAVGLPMLQQANVSERNARTFLGHLRKLANGRGGDAAVVDALNRCAKAQAIDPVTFLQACLKGPPPAGVQPDLDDLTAAVQRRLGITPGDSRQETIDA